VTRRMMGPKQAAHYLGRSTRTLDTWRATGIGPAWHVVAGRIEYAQGDLDAWVDSTRVEPQAVQLPLPLAIARLIEQRARAREARASSFCATNGLQDTPLFATLTG
jgi:hypothetical protein